MTMGEMRARVTLENRDDRTMARAGDRRESEIRRTIVEGIVDTGAVSLVIPEEVAGQLGLHHERTRTVVYADETPRGAADRTGHGRDREPRHRNRVHHRSAGKRGPDRANRARSARPDRGLHEPYAHAAPSRRAGSGPALTLRPVPEQGHAHSAPEIPIRAARARAGGPYLLHQHPRRAAPRPAYPGAPAQGHAAARDDHRNRPAHGNPQPDLTPAEESVLRGSRQPSASSSGRERKMPDSSAILNIWLNRRFHGFPNGSGPFSGSRTSTLTRR